MALVSLTAAVIMTLNALTHKTLQVNHRRCKFDFFEKTFQTIVLSNIAQQLNLISGPFSDSYNEHVKTVGKHPLIVYPLVLSLPKSH